jgi:hypothetical protein
VSDPTYPAAPADRVRPSTVTISTYLLYLVAALQAVGLILVFTTLGPTQEVYADVFEGTEGAEAAETIAIVGTVIGAAVSLLIGVTLVVLGFLNNRGKNGSRIATWIVGGIFLCCTGVGLAFATAGSAMNFGGSSDPDVPDQAEIQRRLEDALPGWYTPVTTAVSVISLLAILTALILLALPRSNEFFRKRDQTYGAPMPGGAYGDPSYPAYPPGEPPLPPPPGTPPPPGPPPPGPPSDR